MTKRQYLHFVYCSSEARELAIDMPDDCELAIEEQAPGKPIHLAVKMPEPEKVARPTLSDKSLQEIIGTPLQGQNG